MELTENVVTLIGHLAWPIGILIIIVIIRKEIILLIRAIRRKIADPHTGFAAGPEGVKIWPEVQAKLDSIVLDSDQFKDLFKALRKELYATQGSVDHKSEEERMLKLREMADEYANVNLETKQQRVKRKNELAKEMAIYAMMNGISKENLAKEDQKEGIIMALAETIRFYPEENDIRWIIKVADKVELKHLKYRILQAMIRLFEKWYIPSEFKPEINQILDEYTKGADPSLSKKISQTREILEKL